MKLASLNQGRDGKLIVVKSDLSCYADASGIADTLQQALDDWATIASKLEDLSDKVENGEIDTKPFDTASVASPLPRAYQIVDGSAYLYHVELVRKARGAEMPPEFLVDPLMYQAVSDTILPPLSPIPIESESFGIDFEAEVAVIVDDVPMGVSAEDAANHIKLIMIMNDVSLRGLIPAELGKGFGFLQSKPPSAFSPVAITPAELEDKWENGLVNLPLISTLNGEEVGRPNCAVDAQFNLPQLVAHAAKTRPLSAGAIVGSGTISNRAEDTGISCLAEIRMIEKIENGEFETPFMKFGDKIRIEMNDEDGRSIFGAIEQEIVPYSYAANQDQKKSA